MRTKDEMIAALEKLRVERPGERDVQFFTAEYIVEALIDIRDALIDLAKRTP